MKAGSMLPETVPVGTEAASATRKSWATVRIEQSGRASLRRRRPVPRWQLGPAGVMSIGSILRAVASAERGNCNAGGVAPRGSE